MTQSSSLKSAPNIRVHWIEIVAISIGGIAIVGAAIAGLGHKLQTNMNQANRVEKIAKNLIAYQFPQYARKQHHDSCKRVRLSDLIR